MKQIQYWPNINHFKLLLPGLISLAKKSSFKYKLAAVILDERNDIISTGVNIRKTHPLQAKYAKQAKEQDKQYLHAEIAAIVRAARLGGYPPNSICVIRVRGNGALANASPCPICRLAIREAGIRTIIYSTDNGSLVKETI